MCDSVSSPPGGFIPSLFLREGAWASSGQTLCPWRPLGPLERGDHPRGSLTGGALATHLWCSPCPCSPLCRCSCGSRCWPGNSHGPHRGWRSRGHSLRGEKVAVYVGAWPGVPAPARPLLLGHWVPPAWVWRGGGHRTATASLRFCHLHCPVGPNAAAPPPSTAECHQPDWLRGGDTGPGQDRPPPQ